DAGRIESPADQHAERRIGPYSPLDRLKIEATVLLDIVPVPREADLPVHVELLVTSPGDATTRDAHGDPGRNRPDVFDERGPGGRPRPPAEDELAKQLDVGLDGILGTGEKRLHLRSEEHATRNLPEVERPDAQKVSSQEQGFSPRIVCGKREVPDEE